MQETLNLKKGLKIKKDQEFFFANDIKIFKLKGCENFKLWKCLEVGQMALTGQLFRGSPPFENYVHFLNKWEGGQKVTQAEKW